MSLVVESLWDTQQREWLQAMGHSLLVLVGDEPADAVSREEIAEVGRARGADVREHATALARDPVEVKPPVRMRPAAPPVSPMPDELTAQAAPARPRTDPAAKLAALEAARRGAARNTTGPLGEALLRATGQPPAAAARALRELAVDQTALRDDPVAKRALWARLRPLRRAAAK